MSGERWRANACHINCVQESTCSTIFAWVSVCAQIVLVNLTVSASKLLWAGAGVVVVCVETLCSILTWTGHTGVHIILTVPSLYMCMWSASVVTK